VKLADHRKPARAHCLTIQNPVEDPDWDQLNVIAKGALRYAVWQLECAPTTKTLHFQCYVEWNRTVRGSVFDQWCKLPPSDARWVSFRRGVDSSSYFRFSESEKFQWCQGIHVEARGKSPEAARQYCMVDVFKGESKGRLDGPWEWGEWSDTKQGKRNDLDTVASFVAKGGLLREVVDRWPSVYCKYERGLRSISEIVAPPMLRRVESWVLWGDTGVGKSHWVYTTFGPANVYAVTSESTLWFDE